VKPEALRELEPDFWRAPSAHNTQPWVLRYREDSVEIGWDPDRTMPAGDPGGRDLRLALGAFTETCLIVCADAGLSVDFLPDLDPSAHRLGHLAEASGPYTTPFTTQDVRGRRTARDAYEPGRLDEAVAGRLEKLAAEEKSEIRRIPCRDLTELLYDADHRMFATPPVIRELREWLRLTPGHPRYHQDGLTDRALLLTPFQARMLGRLLSRRAYPLLRRMGLADVLAGSSRDLLDYDGEVVVLVARPGSAQPDHRRRDHQAASGPPPRHRRPVPPPERRPRGPPDGASARVGPPPLGRTGAETSLTCGNGTVPTTC
jgi:hypothetical protein